MRFLKLPLVLLFSVVSLSAQAHPLVFGDSDGGSRPTNVTQVLERLELASRVLGSEAGIGGFNSLYLVTTRNLDLAISSGHFEDGAFMARFGVVFADLYFEAVSAYFSPSQAEPRAWHPLFKRDRQTQFRRVQFAASGMEAHISRDLPIVLSKLFGGERAYPGLSSLRKRDFDRFNDVIARSFDDLHDELMDGPLWVSIVGDTTALPLIRALRNKAWTDGHALWKIRNLPFAPEVFIQTLDTVVEAQATAPFLIKF